MSNHDGGCMLNEVLELLKAKGVFEKLGKAGAQEIILKVERIGEQHDCSPSEILEGIGGRMGICWWCRSPKEKIRDGICEECRKDTEGGN